MEIGLGGTAARVTVSPSRLNFKRNLMEQLVGKSIVVFDLEIKNEIGKNGITWKTYDKMGISTGCAFDYRTMDYLVFMDDNLQELRKLLAGAELIVGFNIIGFDLPLLAASTAVVEKNPKLEIYDLLFASRKSLGWKEGETFPSGLKLDNHLEETFGKECMKTQDGALAPIFWQQKELGKLISYCLADVKREKMLFEHVVAGKPVKTKAHGEKILELPKYLQMEKIANGP